MVTVLNVNETKEAKIHSVSVIQLLLGSEPRLTSEGSDSLAKKASYWQSEVETERK